MNKAFFVILLIVGLLWCCEVEGKTCVNPNVAEVSTIEAQ